MIQIDDVSLKIKNAEILKHISMDLESGKIHGFVGRNGSGKTMLMKCICGFIYPTKGKITVDGKQVGKDVDFPEDMGVIIETPEFISYMSGFDNLKELASIRKKISNEKIRETLRTVELDPDSKLAVKKYSMGMRQRLGLAQAIMEDPKLLVLDEPFNGLDEDGVIFMRKLLDEKRKQGVTIILSSHNAEDIRVLCDTVHHIVKGEITDESYGKHYFI